MRKIVSLMLILVLLISLCGCGKSQEVKDVENMINNLGEINVYSGDAIEMILRAYDALPDADKEKVSNYGDFENSLYYYLDNFYVYGMKYKCRKIEFTDDNVDKINNSNSTLVNIRAAKDDAYVIVSDDYSRVQLHNYYGIYNGTITSYVLDKPSSSSNEYSIYNCQVEWDEVPVIVPGYETTHWIFTFDINEGDAYLNFALNGNKNKTNDSLWIIIDADGEIYQWGEYEIG